MPRFAAVDVGTNAIRVKVVDATSATAIAPRVTERYPVRLGRGVFLDGRLAPSAIDAAAETFVKIRAAFEAEQVLRYRAVATSAVREGQNREALLDRIYRMAGIELEVVDGGEEARLARLAVVRAADLSKRRALIVDLGGGSLELTTLDHGTVKFTTSLELGTVRLLEAFLAEGKAVTAAQRALLLEYVDRLLGEALPSVRGTKFDVVIGVGGNFDTMAQLCPAPPVAGVPGVAVDCKALAKSVEALSVLAPEARKEQHGMRSDRADVIVPAGWIVTRLAQALGTECIAVPGVGLREGVLAELIEKHFEVWDYAGEAGSVLDAARSLGRRFHFDEQHGEQVRRLARDLFDALKAMHLLGPRERLALEVAALLHDIGDYVNYNRHHKHSAYLIANSELYGLDARTRRLAALVARYHRKAIPNERQEEFAALERKDRNVVRHLAALLRVADALDREHLAAVTRVTVTTGKNTIKLKLHTARDAALEVWTVERKADLLREVLGIKLEVEIADAKA